MLIYVMMKVEVTAELIEHYTFAHERNGQIFHTWLDDANTGLEFTGSMLNNACKTGDQELIELAQLACVMTRTQRWKIYNGLRKVVRRTFARDICPACGGEKGRAIEKVRYVDRD